MGIFLGIFLRILKLYDRQLLKNHSLQVFLGGLILGFLFVEFFVVFTNDGFTMSQVVIIFLIYLFVFRFLIFLIDVLVLHDKLNFTTYDLADCFFFWVMFEKSFA